MKEEYWLNIRQGTIHNALNPCPPAKRMKESNKKVFDNYQEAVEFYGGNDKKGVPCGICLKEKCKGE